jgi:hypothetical protein
MGREQIVEAGARVGFGKGRGFRDRRVAEGRGKGRCAGKGRVGQSRRKRRDG